MIGSAARRSAQMASPRSTREPTSIAALGAEIQSKFVPASETQISSRETPVVISAAPR